MSKIGNIIKSRFIDGKNLPQWYEDRLEICSKCELNSKNSDDRGSITKGWELVAGAHCMQCGCTITQKAKFEDEHCPKGKWDKVNSETYKINNVEIDNLSKDKANIYKEGHYTVVDYGTLNYNSDSLIELHLNIEGASNIRINSSCGCTTPKYEKEGNTYKVKISYNTTLIGDINGKTVRFNYTKQGIPNMITFLLKGTVVR